MDAGFPPDQPAHVIGQVSQSDFRGGPGDPDGAHDQPEAALLGRKHRLNSRAHPRAGSVGPSLHGGEAEPRSAAEVNLRDEAVLLQKRLVGFRAVGRIGPDRAGGVRLVQNRPKLSPVVGCCVRDREPPHEAVGSIDADVVLVAKHRDGNLDPPLPRGLGGRLGPGPLQVQRASRSFWASLLGWSCQPLGLVLPASWAGPASLLGWSCQPLGLVLPASWAGPASLLGCGPLGSPAAPHPCCAAWGRPQWRRPQSGPTWPGTLLPSGPHRRWRTSPRSRPPASAARGRARRSWHLEPDAPARAQESA